MFVKKADNIIREEVKAGKNTTRQVLISSQEGPHFAMRRFTIEAGGSMPFHTNTVEHEQYVVSGRARIQIGDEVTEVKKDDVVFIPQGIPHSYTTLGDEPFVFLCMIPNKEDIIEIVKE